MSGENVEIRREAVFNSVVSEAAGFYRVIVTVASSFLGGTLLFVERIAPTPRPFWLVVLGVGWLCLIASITAAVTWVRRLNLESGHLALSGQYDGARRIDHRSRRWSSVAAGCLAVGMLLVSLTGLGHLWPSDGTKGDLTMVSPRQEDNHGRWLRKSIPYGDVNAGREVPQAALSDAEDPEGPNQDSVNEAQPPPPEDDEDS
jgi:hypothetical protein